MKKPQKSKTLRALQAGLLASSLLTAPAFGARLAYEGFDYTEADGTSIGGLNGGSGWEGAFPPPSGGPLTLQPGLTFLGGNAPVTIGKSMNFGANANMGAGRDWDNSASAPVDGTYYYSFQIDPIAAARGTFIIMKATNSGDGQNGFGIRLDDNSGNPQFKAWTPTQGAGPNIDFPGGYGSTYFVVGKITIVNGGTSTNAVSVFNSAGTIPLTEPASFASSATADATNTANLRTTLSGRAFGNNTGYRVDEIRVSTTYEELFPAPPGVPTFALDPISAVENQTLTFTWENIPANSQPTLDGNPVSIDGTGAGTTTLPAPAFNTTFTLDWIGAETPLTQDFTAIAPFFTISPSSGYLGDTLTLNWRIPAGATAITLDPNPDSVTDMDGATIPETGIGTATIAAPTSTTASTTAYTITWTGAGNGATGVSQTFTLLPSFLNVTPDPAPAGNALAVNWRISPEWDDHVDTELNQVRLQVSTVADFSSLEDELPVGGDTDSFTGAGNTTLTAALGVNFFRLVYNVGGVETIVSDTISVFDPYFNNLVYTPTAPEVREWLDFASGVNAYTDRNHQWVSVPDVLVGGHYLRLRQGDRNNAALGVTFDADPGTTVFVLIDNRVGDEIGGTTPESGSDSPPVVSALPGDWVTANGFLDSGLDVGSDEGADGSVNNTYSVFFKQIPADAESPATSFTLGAMDGVGATPPGRGVYGVVIKKPQVVPVSFHAYVGTLDLAAPVPVNLFWTLPTDATNISIDSGVGPQSINANGQGSVPVNPPSTTTYTLTASSASLGAISRTTTVTVTGTPPASGFGAWITGNFGGNTVPSGQQGPNDDPDGDGIDNLMEFAIAGGDPTRSNASPAVISGTLVTFNKNTEATGITYALEKSSTLANDWVPATPTTNDANVITFTLAPPTPSKDFVRLKVTQN